MIFIYLIAFIVLVNLIAQVYLFKDNRLRGFSKTNFLLVFAYNIAGWWYIIHYLDEGGASLGPGLTLMFFSGIHLAIAIIFFFASLYRR